MDGDAMPEAPSASGRVAKRSLRLLLLAVVAAALLVVTRWGQLYTHATPEQHPHARRATPEQHPHACRATPA
eukprot:231118-Chlamydomonas_euryale.AAC.1